MDELPNFMPGIAPITSADAVLFAHRYLGPDLAAGFVGGHQDGDNLAAWWPKLDDDTRFTVTIDCILSDWRLPYAERLAAIDADPKRATYLKYE